VTVLLIVWISLMKPFVHRAIMSLVALTENALTISIIVMANVIVEMGLMKERVKVRPASLRC
jgi:hypothetical protein